MYCDTVYQSCQRDPAGAVKGIGLLPSKHLRIRDARDAIAFPYGFSDIFIEHIRIQNGNSSEKFRDHGHVARFTQRATLHYLAGHWETELSQSEIPSEISWKSKNSRWLGVLPKCPTFSLLIHAGSPSSGLTEVSPFTKSQQTPSSLSPWSFSGKNMEKSNVYRCVILLLLEH